MSLRRKVMAVTSSIAACELWKIRDWAAWLSHLWALIVKSRALLRMVLSKRPMNDKKTIKLNLTSCTIGKARIR